MKIATPYLRFTLVIGVLLIAPSLAHSQAYLRWQQAARPAGLAGAAAALDGDASAVFHNPAGIVHLPGTRVQANGFFTVGESRLRVFGGENFQASDSPILNGSLYLTHAVAQRLTLGLSLTTPWGFATEWARPGEFAGRFRAAESRFESVQFNPVIAYGPVGPWSAALGLDLLHSRFGLLRFEQDPAISALGGGGPIALARTELDADGVDVGWNAGVAFRPSGRFQAGLQYRSGIEVAVSGFADFTVIAPPELRSIPLPDGESTIGEVLDDRYVDQPVHSTLSFPSVAVLGVAFRPIEELQLTADAQWIGWEAVDSLALIFADTALQTPIPLLYDDSWVLRWGAELEVRPGLRFRLGYAWQESPAPSATVSPLLPDAGRDTYATGVGFRWAGMDVDLGYSLSVFDDREGVAFPGGSGAADGLYEALRHELSAGISRQL